MTEEYKEMYRFYKDLFEDDGLTPEVNIGTPKIEEENHDMPEIEQI